MTYSELFWMGVWPLLVAGVVLLADYWQAKRG